MAVFFRREQRDEREPLLEERSDEELVHLAQRDRDVFGELYRRYHGDIRNFVRSRVGGDPDMADDITSLVFTKAIAALPKYTDGPFRAWLYRIARNTIIDEYRRKKPDTTIDDIDEPTAATDDPLDHAVAADAAARLQDALLTLKPGQREILRLRLHGLSVGEIAERLNMSESAIKSAQRRAFLALRDHPGVQP